MKTSLFNLFTCFILLAGLLGGGPAVSPAAAEAPTSPQAAPQNGALNLIHIPFSAAAPTIDGACGQKEYSGGSGYSFIDGSGDATVNIINDGANLYICVVAPNGAFAGRFMRVYLDPQANGATYTFAQQDDFALQVKLLDGARSSYNGSGVSNGYLAVPSLDSQWSAAVDAIKYDQVEYKIPLKSFGLTRCGIFGLAVYHHWFAGVGNDYGWPSAQWFDQPRTWQLATLDNPDCTAAGKIAYVFRGDTLSASSFFNLLASAGYQVTLVPLTDVITTDFSLFNLILIADDTGSLDQWGTSGLTADQVMQINTPNKPMIGLGEGGYAFFGKSSLPLGWPHGWHGPQSELKRAASAPPGYFTGIATDPIPVTTAPQNSVGIYLPPMPAGVTEIGTEVPTSNHSGLIQQGCRLLWGNGGDPLTMASDGKTLFLNSVGYMRYFQCSPVTPPSPKCFSISKAASPTSGPLTPGDTIDYTITYKLNSIVGAGCPTSASGFVIDSIPAGATYVPNSANPAVVLSPEGALSWPVNATTSDQILHFKVTVNDTACNAANPVVSNTALWRPSGAADMASNPVSHAVTCVQPVSFPTSDPFYAESELSIDPYPLVTGLTTRLSVRVRNSTSEPKTVTAHFQTSPARFGIGLDYADLPIAGNPATATVPANGESVLSTSFTPPYSGNLCLQVAVTTAGASTPMLTQRCIDATEHLLPGVPELLTIPVGNPTGATADIILVVDNTCPGWSAVITNPPAGVLVGVLGNDTDIRSATLQVTPRTPGPLGSGCHIDVQGWIGSRMIGGIRKLDLPAVQLPHANPVWEEPEISFVPDPPVAGSAGQICIRLANPLAVSQSVSVDFQVADFGAGVGFTPATSLPTTTLPPFSIATYCAPWTPVVSGTLHRCVLAVLHQAGYLDQYSQHNIDIVHPSSPAALVVPFVIGNPDLVSHALTLRVNLVGFTPPWHVVFELANPSGGPLPASIGAGQILNLQARLSTALGDAAPLAATPPFISLANGSLQAAEVTLLLDGVPSGGFSLHFPPQQVFIPQERR